MMADKRIGELPSAPGVYDDTLLVGEQQGAAVKITAGQLRNGLSSGGGTGGGEVIAGPGVASGGATGQVLAKKSNADYDTQWIDPPQGGDGDVDLSLYAPKAYPVFTGNISLGSTPGVEIGAGSVAIGGEVQAPGMFSAAIGAFSKSNEMASCAFGFDVTADAKYQCVVGMKNIISSSEFDRFIVGGGSTGYNIRANCFRVAQNAVFAAGSYNTSGADYAEMFEWADGNSDNEDRVGRFVTLDGAKIRIAEPGDDYILGIVSGNPSVVGDVHDDQWKGIYLYDIFGRLIWEDAEIPEQKDSTGRVLSPAHVERRPKQNPNYDNAQKYTPRSERPEWDAVGMLGKLVTVDDGSCVVNGWCTVGEGGVATASESRTKYRVMERLNENHIRVMIL